MSKDDFDIDKSEYFEVDKPKTIWATHLIDPRDNKAVTHHTWRWVTVGVFVALLFANIYFDWQIPGIASVVMAAMAAWYFVRLLIELVPRLKSQRAKTNTRPKN